MLSLKRALAVGVALAIATAALAQYRQVNLVSDGTIPAAHTDTNLVNAWGMAFSPTGPFWINDNGTGLSTVYDGTGAPFPINNPLVVHVPPLSGSAPTGIVFNGTQGFTVTNGTATLPSVFIFVTEDGVISGWNPGVNADGVPVLDNVVPDSNYKGAALANVGTHTFLYATNFSEGKVDVFDSTWTMVGSFTDATVPIGYVPFGIANVNGFLVVTFALAGGDDDIPGPGHGYVDVFWPNGHLLRRLISQGPLNSPWGIAIAPHHFGEHHDQLLIGNFGDGRINAFALPTGRFTGPLRQSGRDHGPIEIEGLWALAVGNGHNAGSRDNVYFTAGPDDESHGLFGYITRSEHDH